MTDWLLSSDPNQPRQGRWSSLPLPQISRLSGPENYIAEDALIDAINTSLALGQPLLVTGDPGCGKTELGAFLAWKLGLGDAIRFDSTTEMQAQDLFYSFDTVARFHAAQSAAHDPGARVDAVNFIRYHGLGEAIIRGSAPGRYAHLLPEAFNHTDQRRSVVLIDEIDKASRDVPNNLLRVMERPSFFIPELAYQEVVADEAFRPIIVLTSNSEKSLPDAFLRRCVYYHMPFPEADTLREIVASRIAGFPSTSGLVADAIALLGHLRGRCRLRKAPGTAELLAFILALRGNGFGVGDRLRGQGRWLPWAKVSLLKTREDQEQAATFFANVDWPA